MQLRRISWLAIVCLLACGQVEGNSGGSLAEGGIGGSGISTGPIVAFGSIFVNGIEWFVDESEIEIDEGIGREDDLRIGMVVRVEGEIDHTNNTGTARRVFFDDDLEGPVQSITPVGGDGSSKELEVLGRRVLIEAHKTRFDEETGTSGFDFSTIALGDVVEISGLIDPDRVIHATYVELKGAVEFGATRVELKGVISGLAGGATFMIGGTTIHFDDATDISDLPDGVENDLYVEVEGILISAQEINAEEIEIEDEFDDDDPDEVSVTGFVWKFEGVDDFFVGNQGVDASTAEFEQGDASMLEDGVLIEVDGDVVDGVLIADEIGFRAS